MSQRAGDVIRLGPLGRGRRQASHQLPRAVEQLQRTPPPRARGRRDGSESGPDRPPGRDRMTDVEIIRPPAPPVNRRRRGHRAIHESVFRPGWTRGGPGTLRFAPGIQALDPIRTNLRGALARIFERKGAGCHGFRPRNPWHPGDFRGDEGHGAVLKLVRMGIQALDPGARSALPRPPNHRWRSHAPSTIREPPTPSFMDRGCPAGVRRSRRTGPSAEEIRAAPGFPYEPSPPRI